MLDSAKASDAPDAQEYVFDIHLKKISSDIARMLNKKPKDEQIEANNNFDLLEKFHKTLKQLPRDLFAFKSQAKACLEKLTPDNKSIDFILSMGAYLDHELTLIECFVSQVEELRQDYLKKNKGWHAAAVNLGPLLKDSHSKKDLAQLKTMLLEFCNTQLVTFRSQSKSFKPNIEAIANAIPSTQCALAAGTSIPSQAVQSVREQLQKQEANADILIAQMDFIVKGAASNKVEKDAVQKLLESQKDTAHSLRLQLQKSEADAALLALQLQVVTEQLSVLKIEKEENRRETAKPNFFENLLGLTGDSNDAQPILHAHKGAAKAAASPRAPRPAPPTTASSTSTATPLVITMEDGKKRGNNPNVRK